MGSIDTPRHLYYDIRGIVSIEQSRNLIIIFVFLH